MMSGLGDVERLIPDAALMAAINFSFSDFNRLELDIKELNDFALSFRKQAVEGTDTCSMLEDIIHDIRNDMEQGFERLFAEQNTHNVNAFMSDYPGIMHTLSKALFNYEQTGNKQNKVSEMITAIIDAGEKQEAALRAVLPGGQVINMLAPSFNDEPLRLRSHDLHQQALSSLNKALASNEEADSLLGAALTAQKALYAAQECHHAHDTPNTEDALRQAQAAYIEASERVQILRLQAQSHYEHSEILMHEIQQLSGQRAAMLNLIA
ncbi:hypothetical protein [Aeromonas caviae]|uniref:hypothetical protein n=1 Tax=Aeromonas caviae TaxID=648 RepID=UPI00385DE3F7